MKKVISIVTKVISTILIIAVLSTIPSFKVSAAVTSNGAIAKGIDVSKYQGTINWSQVAASGIKFAFIRIGTTYGGTPNLDPTFLYNLTQAQANGIKVGVYMYSYATTPEAAAVEAQLTLAWLGNYGLQLPVVYDVEDKCHKSMSTVDLYNMINTYCAIIDAAGYYPMVYTYKSFYHGKLGTSPWDKWMAQYNDSLNTPEKVAFWQYSSSGSVPGIGTRVDMNYQYKDYSNLIINEGFLAHGTGTRFYRGYKMQTGWIDYQGHKYFADGLGYIQKGWLFDASGKMFFLDLETGAAAVGPTTVSGYTFYFGPDGAQQYGFIDYGSGNKYFDPTMNGAMATNWFFYNGTTHYADKDGNQAIGLTEINGIQYFFDADGAVVVNQTIDIDGIPYMAAADGALTPVPQIEGGMIDPVTGLMFDAATGCWINPTTGEVGIAADGTINNAAIPALQAKATAASNG